MESNSQIFNKSKITSEPMKELSWTQLANGYSALQAIKKKEEHLMKRSDTVSISNQAKDKKTLDNSVKFKVDKMVFTEWGIGKITSVSNESRSCKVKIEGDEVSFGFDFITPFINIFFCVLTKSRNDWIALKFNIGDIVGTIRRKLSTIYVCHYSQILLVHSGEKLTSDSEKLSELGLFEGDEMLAVVKDPQAYSYAMFSLAKKMTLSSGCNSISFNVNENIMLTGILFYRNDSVEIMLDLTISENTDDSNMNVLYQVFNLSIKAVDPLEGNNTIQIDFPSIPIKKGRDYEIKQTLNQSLANQYIGCKLSDDKQTGNGVKFDFFDSNKKSDHRKIKSNFTNNSLFLGLYYVIQTGRE